MAYRVQYDSGVLKAIRRLPRPAQFRVVSHIGSLSREPRPRGAIKLAGREAYRIRVGDYRIIYAIFDETLVVLVIDVGDRKDVYRR